MAFFGIHFLLLLGFGDHPASDLASRLPSRRLHDALVGARVRFRPRPLQQQRQALKSGFLRGSPKSGGSVCGQSPIWLKLAVVSCLDLKSLVDAIILIFGGIKVDLGGIFAQNLKKS